MSADSHWLELPHVEWHHGRPFVRARLSLEYARTLEALAHRCAPTVLALPGVHAPEHEAINPTASRYPHYNAFLLDGCTLPLFMAIRRCHRVLVAAIDGERRGRFIKCWYNITGAGQVIARHRHRAVFIGTFAARAQGSVTRFGLTHARDDGDHCIENHDGQLLLTTGMNHYHEVEGWNDQAHRRRVTYAFDIINASQWRTDRLQVPFDDGSGDA